MSTKASDRAKITEKAEHFVKAGKVEEAVAEYRKLLDGSGQDISIGNIIGDLCLQLRQEDKALELFLANVETLERRGAYSQALAIAKKINKIRPDDPTGMIRLADLYGQLGFSTEARSEYVRAAAELEKRNETKPLIALYEKQARIDRSDLVTRLKLARLYLEDGRGEQAQVILNDAADLLYVRKEYGEAEKILLEAAAIGDADIRTLSNLLRIYREMKKPEASLGLLDRVIRKRGPRPDLLGLQAGLFSEQGDEDRASDIYALILDKEPDNYDIRAKAGLAEIRRGHLDSALAIFDPLVSHFLQKSDEDRAAGLLGLILISGSMHLPTLERLTGVFRGAGRTRELETCLKVLLQEFRNAGRENDRIRVLRELYMLIPLDPDISREADELGVKRELRKPAEKPGTVATEEDREMIRLNLAKAELYVEQGLIRNARRILENLKLLFPDEPRIHRKYEEIRNADTSLEEEEIPEVVEDTSRREVDIIGTSPKATTVIKPAPLPSPSPVQPSEPPPQGPPKSRVTGERSASPDPAPTKTVPLPPPPSEPPSFAPVQAEPSELPEPPFPLPAPEPAPVPIPPPLGLEEFVSETPEMEIPGPPVRESGSPQTAPAPPASPATVFPPPITKSARAKRPTPVFSVRGGPASAHPAVPSPHTDSSRSAETASGSKVTAEQIFAGLDIGPFVLPPEDDAAAGPGYIDITDKIEEEIEALEAEFYKQIKERTSVIEKDLLEIVQEFRRQVDIKLDQRNYEARYNLGLAFLEQGLYEEAIAEFELAAGDESRAADCWGLIGQCYVKKRNYPEARRCFEGAISLTPADSPERFALAYELASLYEMMGENEAALALYREVSSWNPKFRNTAKRVKILEKIVT